MSDRSIERKIPRRILDLQRGVDRAHEIADAMKRGEKPPADEVLKQLGGLREFLVERPLRLVEEIRGAPIPGVPPRSDTWQKIADDAALFEATLGVLDQKPDNAPNAITYIWNRWPILS